MIRRVWQACAGIGLTALIGCAGNSAYLEGQRLLNEQRPLDALERFEQATKLDPQSPEVRAAWLRLRARLVAEWLEHGHRKREGGDLDGADELFRKVLRADPANEAAVLGLRAAERERGWDRLIDQANASLQGKDFNLARARLRIVLAESPRHARALQLQKLLDQMDPVSSPEAVLGAGYRKVLSLEFKDASLKSIFEILAKTSGLNFVFDKDVRTDQRTSVFLRNSTVEAAVSRVLTSNQLAQRVLDGNSILIYPDTPAKQKDYQLLSVRTFYLSNGDAKAIANSVKTILKVKDVVVDERLNALVVRDSPDAVRLIERMVALLDLPEPEVMLEVEVLEVKRSDLLNLGVRWPDQVSLSPLASGTSGAVTLSDLRSLGSGTAGVSLNPLTISARQDNAATNLLANPKIRAKSREKARILIGERVPNITTTSTSTGFVADSVNYIDVGLKLEVEPTVFPEGDVVIKMALEVSSLVSQVQTKSGTLAYQIGTRSAATALRLRDGENQVLAGLLNDEERRSANRVPVLGSAPLLGRLFGGGTDEAVKSEIVLSITPRVLRNIQRPDASLLDFESGTESSLRGRQEGAAPVSSGRVEAPLGVARGPAAVKGPAPPSSNATPTADVPTSGVSVMPSTPTTEASPATDTNFRWDSPSSVKLGQVFTVRLLIDARKPVIAVPLALGFDPTVLEVVEVTDGDFLPQGDVPTTMEKRLDASGQVLVTAKRVGESGATGTGPVLTMRFRALKAAAPTFVRVLTLAPEGEKGAALSATVPTPLSLAVTP